MFSYKCPMRFDLIEFVLVICINFFSNVKLRHYHMTLLFLYITYYWFVLMLMNRLRFKSNWINFFQFLHIDLGNRKWSGHSDRRSERPCCRQTWFPCTWIRRQHKRMHISRTTFQSNQKRARRSRCNCSSCRRFGQHWGRCQRRCQSQHFRPTHFVEWQQQYCWAYACRTRRHRWPWPGRSRTQQNYRQCWRTSWMRCNWFGCLSSCHCCRGRYLAAAADQRTKYEIKFILNE